jgi:hypothetical protein
MQNWRDINNPVVVGRGPLRPENKLDATRCSQPGLLFKNVEVVETAVPFLGRSRIKRRAN